MSIADGIVIASSLGQIFGNLCLVYYEDKSQKDIISELKYGFK